MLNNYMLTIDNFLIFWSKKKIILLFLFGQLLQSGAPLLGLANSIYYFFLKVNGSSYKIHHLALQNTPK